MTIRLPSLEDCQAVLDLVTGGGTDYRSVSNEVRVKIVKLAINADMNDSLAILADGFDALEKLTEAVDNLPVALAECETFMTLNAKLTDLGNHMNNIAVDTDLIGQWFKHSKLWDGL